MSIIFGPVPSRRLGKSLGINNIPPKECTYTCVYCQLGNTIKLEVERQKFFSPKTLSEAIERYLSSLDSNEKIDYLTFVPDGEPTLDANLHENILALKKIGIKIAVITNSSLIFKDGVKKALLEADWVSVKIDAIGEDVWKKIDRPHGALNYNKILTGLKEFSVMYDKFLATETMLVKGINDDKEEIERVVDFIKSLNAKKSYITIPTRPPAESHVESPELDILNNAFQIFSERELNVELLIGYEGNEFSSTGDFKDDLLNITSVHPMRWDAVEKLMMKNGADEQELNDLIENNTIKRIEYNGEYFYLRNLKKWRKELN